MKMCIDRPLDPYDSMQAAQQENPQNIPNLDDLGDDDTIQTLQQQMVSIDIQHLPPPPANLGQDVLAAAAPDSFRQIEDRMLEQLDPQMRMQVLDNNQQGSLSILYLTLMTGKRWANGRELRVAFLGGHPTVQARVIELARQWEAYANIHFDFLTDPNQPSDIRVSFELNNRSWSRVGTDALLAQSTEPTMNFGWLTPTSSDDTYSRVVLHEFGHALGAIHEHQSPAAEIPWNREAVYAFYGQPPNNWSTTQVDINLFGKYAHDQLNYSTFDPASIMLYAIDNELTLGDWEVGWNSQLSVVDREFIAQMYPKDGSTTGSTTDGTAVLALGAHLQSAIEAPGQVKVFTFNADIEGTYIFETTGITDVTMALHATEHGAEPLAFDDDSGEAWNARIMRQLAPGHYKVRVQHYQDTGTGAFGISVK
ncbi:MAG: hypothetical protein KJZ93_31540 [Caldilineaceae bacterium]|nr:hypothetical protein [Caldilineaceae bacterium]